MNGINYNTSWYSNCIITIRFNLSNSSIRAFQVHLALISVYISIICLLCHLLRTIPTIWEVLEVIKLFTFTPTEFLKSIFQRVETERKRIPPTLASPDWLFILLPVYLTRICLDFLICKTMKVFIDIFAADQSFTDHHILFKFLHLLGHGKCINDLYYCKMNWPSR